MSVSITGTSSNVQINNADLHVTNASKKVIAPKAEFSGSDVSDISLTTSSNVGLVNTAPIHTLDVGSKFFVDETGATTVRVRGLLEADTINFGGSTADRVFVSDANGALSTDDGLQYNSSTNALTLAGALDANSTADIADTLTLSKATGTGLSVTADATVGGTIGVTGAATLSSTLEVTGTTTLDGALDANSTADIADTLTLSKATGTGLDVNADATVGGTLNVDGATTITTLSSNAITARGNLVVVNNDGTNNMIISAANGTSSVSGNFGVGGLATLNNGLRLTSGASLLKDLYANATTITNGLTVSSGTTDVQALTATSGGFTGAVGIDGDFDIATNKFTVASDSGNTIVAGTLSSGAATLASASVTGTLSSGAATLASASVTGAATVGTTLDVTGATTLSSTLNSGAATLASASVTNNATVGGTLGVTGASTLSSASITGAGNALTVSNNAVISGQMRADSGLIDNNLQVNGNLVVDGELTVIQTNNLVVDDPLIELGNTNTNGGAIIDVGMVFRQPSGNSNVVTFYDGSDSKYRIGLTNNGAYDTAITTTGAIEVEVTGNVTADTITADAINLGGSNIRIEGNSIVFG